MTREDEYCWLATTDKQRISMAVPDYQSLMLPLLRYAGKLSEEISTANAIDALANDFNLTPDDLAEMLPSGSQSTFVNRVG
jgi:restriction system protein